MNPLLNTLQPYPFAKLRKLLEGAKLPEDLKPISLSIGEPKHPTPSNKPSSTIRLYLKSILRQAVILS